MKHIVLTGGGTAGHVTPNIALIPKLKEAGYKISYIGSYDGMERKLIEDLGIPYYGISSGKLRRYFDPKNFSDPFRQELLSGDAREGLKFCGFNAAKPVILVIGGSLGSVAVNTAVRSILPELLKDFQVIHLCGKDKLDASLNGTEGYVQFEYIKDELPDLFAAADLIISRAGANAICEISALAKPNILIPLSANASRGDQILNARSFERQGYSKVLEEESVNAQTLQSAIREVYENRQTYINAMKKSSHTDSIGRILSLIQECERK